MFLQIFSIETRIQIYEELHHNCSNVDCAFTETFAFNSNRIDVVAKTQA